MDVGVDRAGQDDLAGEVEGAARKARLTSEIGVEDGGDLLADDGDAGRHDALAKHDLIGDDDEIVGWRGSLGAVSHRMPSPPSPLSLCAGEGEPDCATML